MLTKIFCEIDDFCKEFIIQFNKNLLTSGKNIRNRSFKLTLSEIITISIYYHHSGYKTFKDYYTKHVLVYMNNDFKNLVSYNRFLELRAQAMLPIMIYLQLNIEKYKCMGVSFIDSFSINVSHTKRISSHKVFKGIAQRGKTSVGWFYGFKVHLIINVFGEIIAFYITPGNVSDNNGTVITKLTKKIFGKVFGDKGYLINKDLFHKLFSSGIHFVTKARKNMKNKLMDFFDKFMLKNRGIIESVGSILKESLSLEHSRHRSMSGFLFHVIATICAYNFKPNKPSLFKKLIQA
jgi:hypothetical protein